MERPAGRRGLTFERTCEGCGSGFFVERYRAERARWCSLACRFPSTEERFAAKIDRGTDPLGCWLWTGFRNAAGYGQFGRNTPAHRYAYTLWVGPIPGGCDLDHLCRNPPCVRPSHLEPISHRANLLRGNTFAARNAAAAACPQGHAYDEENTYVRPDGRGRDCRACRRERNRNRG